MGKCTSKTQSDSHNTEQIIDSDSDPCTWSQKTVLQWISTLDLNIQPDEQSKIYKKFKKHKINGRKLTELTTEKLKKKLKIHPVGTRLEIMKVINKKKTQIGYPSPLYSHNKYQLPQYYPDNYKYKIDIYDIHNSQKNIHNQDNNNSRVHGPTQTIQKERQSWTIGTIVLLNLEEYETWCAAQIIEITGKSDAFLFGINERLTDFVTVIYDLGNGIFDRKKIYRWDATRIQSDERFLRNRWKLQRYCMVEVFNTFTNQWHNSYIKKLGRINKNDFVIANTNGNKSEDDLRCDRWDPKIRCSEALLNLTINSELHILNCFDKDKYAYCAKIIEIYNNDECAQNIYTNDKIHKLDIFKVIYKTLDNKYYYKYIHQFSANILLINTDFDRPKEYTDLEVVMHSNSAQYDIQHDKKDQLHTEILLKGWLRKKLRKYKPNYQGDLVNLLTLLMQQCGYHNGPIYGLVLYLEAKYWGGKSTSSNST